MPEYPMGNPVPCAFLPRASRATPRLRLWLLPAMGALALACSPVTPATSPGGGASSSGGSSSSSGGGSSSSGSGGSSGGGIAEVCDGIDNDGDGIIDNVDADGDGVCDCLKVATLGFPGQWGTGDVFATWLSAKSTKGATTLGDAVLTEATLAPYQIIIAQDVRLGNVGQFGKGSGIGRTYSADELEVLRQWVAHGGGLMTLLGYADSSEVTNVNALLAPYGLSYGSTQVLQGGNGPNGWTTVPVEHWDTSHPIATGISRVGVDSGYPVQGGGTLVAWAQSTNGQVDAGRALVFEKGHVFAWADEWITYDSEWTQHTDYQVSHFWVNTLKWLSPANQCQVPTPHGEW